MVTRQDVVEAALQRYDAMQRAKETEAAMTAALVELRKARDAHMQAITASNEATRAHAAMEKKLMDQSNATGAGNR
jgi:hypothetical protein